MATAKPEQFGWSSKKLEVARERMNDDKGQRFEIMDAIVIVRGHDIWHYGEAYKLRPGLKTQHDWAHVVVPS